MAYGALESLDDPLIDPILALLKAAVNADIAAALPVAPDEPSDERAAVLVTRRMPLELAAVGEGETPVLACYRVRSKVTQFTAIHTDHIDTLQFVYASPSCDQDLLDERWAVLDRVWRSALRALKRGKHPEHEDGEDVLEDAGVVRVDYATAWKREIFVPHGGLTYPGFIAEIDVTWRPEDEQDSTVYPDALSFDGKIFVDTDGDYTGDPDVIARAVTEAGIAVPGTGDEGRDFETPDDWSLPDA